MNARVNWAYQLPDAAGFSGRMDAKGDVQTLIIEHVLQAPYQIESTIQLTDVLETLRIDSSHIWGSVVYTLADGREVVIFFNVKAPPLARKELSDTVKFKEMPPVRAMIADLLKQGAKMVVCPMCAEITGVEADQLAPGIDMIEDRKQIFDHMHFNSVVFTY